MWGRKGKQPLWKLVTGEKHNEHSQIAANALLSADLAFFTMLSLKWQVSQLLKASEDIRLHIESMLFKNPVDFVHQNCGDSRNHIRGQVHQGKPKEPRAKNWIKDVSYIPETVGIEAPRKRNDQKEAEDYGYFNWIKCFKKEILSSYWPPGNT